MEVPVGISSVDHSTDGRVDQSPVLDQVHQAGKTVPNANHARDYEQTEQALFKGLFGGQ